jgi:hypothetical protein
VQSWTEPGGRPSHAGLTVNAAGQEVVVGVSQIGGGISNPEDGRIISRRMSDGFIQPLTDFGYGIHASARNYLNRNGVLVNFADISSPWDTHRDEALLIDHNNPGAFTIAIPDLGFTPGDSDYWAEPQPSISPDGAYVIWAARVSGQVASFVRRLA